jgi:hypothetical protein
MYIYYTYAHTYTYTYIYIHLYTYIYRERLAQAQRIMATLASQFFLNDGASLAVLSSASGTMHFFSLEALKLWLEAEQQMVLMLNAHSGKSLLPFGTDFGAQCPSASMGNSSHDGYSLEQWVKFAKKKSSIASATCRRNGELKHRLAMYEPLPIRHRLYKPLTLCYLQILG